MNFISITYGLFLLSVLGVYWTVETENIRLCVLLIASIIFYTSYQPAYILLLLVLVFINYRIGIELGENTSPRQHSQDWQISNEEWQYAQADWNRRRLILISTGVFINIFILFGFKYFIPLLKFALPQATTTSLGLDSLKLIAPLGISYFVFECIAYLVDIYRGAPATGNFIKFAAYKLFLRKLLPDPLLAFINSQTSFKLINFLQPIPLPKHYG